MVLMHYGELLQGAMVSSYRELLPSKRYLGVLWCRGFSSAHRLFGL